MRSIWTRPTILALGLSALLVAGMAYDLIASSSRAREGLEREFSRRASLAAGLTSAALGSTVDQWKGIFSGPERGLEAAMRHRQAFEPDPAAAVLDAGGRPLVLWPSAQRAAGIARSETARRARAGHVAISDLEVRGARRFVTLGMPFELPGGGRRIVVELLAADAIESFASAYLASAPAIDGGRAYLVDGRGLVLAASQEIAQGSALPDRRLVAALAGRSSGSYGDRYFAAAPLAGTRWRVVLTAPQQALFAPVRGSTRRSAWLLFAALVAALVGLVAVGIRAQRTSAQLTGAYERERAAQRLAHARLHDGLTGLPNRALFLDRGDNALAVAERRGEALAVLFVDLDRFKRINDSLGHASGDELLKLVAARLEETVREGDTVSRFGGDEFLILCTDLDGVDAALQVAQRVHAALERPFQLGPRSVHVSCCTGIALQLAGASRTDAAALVRDADAAMYSAKAEGAARIRVFDADLHGEALQRLDMEVALRAAVADGELRVHYQPIVTLPGGRLRGVEALVRWERPEVGLVPPLDFIHLAEESGLIADIGRWVLATAMEDVAAWSAAGIVDDDFALSVNVSARQLAGGELLDTVAALLAGWELAPSQLWLEITESAVASDPQLAQREIHALCALGVRVAIDDFGVGQSSLEQLVHTLPVDILKLDRSFTTRLADRRERAVVAAIAPMAAALEMTAIAEGVESSAQAAALSELGYPLAQGFHFGRPVDAEAMRGLLRGALEPPKGLPLRR